MAGTTLYFQSTDSGIPHPALLPFDWSSISNPIYCNLTKTGNSPYVTGSTFLPTGGASLPCVLIGVSDPLTKNVTFDTTDVQMFMRSRMASGHGTPMMQMRVVTSSGTPLFSVIHQGTTENITGSAFFDHKVVDGISLTGGVAVSGNRIVIEYGFSADWNKMKTVIGRPSGVAIIDPTGYVGSTVGVPWFSTNKNLFF